MFKVRKLETGTDKIQILVCLASHTACLGLSNTQPLLAIMIILQMSKLKHREFNRPQVSHKEVKDGVGIQTVMTHSPCTCPLR